jgi:hypothetical protein
MAPLLWIVRQPACDLATALQIYCHAEPGYFREFGTDRPLVPQHAREVFDLIWEIRRRVDDGQYTRRELAFDAQSYCPTEPDPSFPALSIRLTGRGVTDSAFSDGFPVALYAIAAEKN